VALLIPLQYHLGSAIDADTGGHPLIGVVFVGKKSLKSTGESNEHQKPKNNSHEAPNSAPGIWLGGRACHGDSSLLRGFQYCMIWRDRPGEALFVASFVWF
jgi:hypothetical protein